MDLPSAIELKALVAALAPGLVIIGVRQRFVAGPVPSLQDRAISYAAVSAVYYAIANPLFAFLVSQWGLLPWAANGLESIALPAVLGLFFGVVTGSDWVGRFWRKAGVQPVHHVPTAWDYTFSRLQNGTFILVTLTDGSTIAGLYGDGSFSSSTSGERDLLIGEVWEIVGEDWTKSATPKSILVCGRDIRTVELFKQA